MYKLLTFLFAFPLFGAYVGNPADPALMNTGFFSTTYPIFKFTTGYIYDYTSNMRFETNSSDAIKQFGLHSQQASFSFIFVERLQLFGSAGGSKETVQGRDLSDMVFDSDTNYHFSWSAGCKVIFLQWGQTFLSGDFTWFEIPASEQSYFKYLNRMNVPLTGKQEFSMRSWQGSLGLSSRFYFLTPYGGATYQKAKLHAETNYNNSVNWGFFYGLTISLTGRLHVNLERRVRDEFAYSLATIAVF